MAWQSHSNALAKLIVEGHFFKVALLLRESLFQNGMLTDTEVWNGVTKYHVEHLEFVDKILLRQFLDTPVSFPLEGVQLDLGVIRQIYYQQIIFDMGNTNISLFSKPLVKHFNFFFIYMSLYKG